MLKHLCHIRERGEMDAQSQSLKQPIVWDTSTGRVGDKVPQNIHILAEAEQHCENTAVLACV